MPSNIRYYKNSYPKFDHTCYLDPSAILIGDITIGEDSSIWPLVAARGDVNHITIGSRTNIQDGTVLHVSRPSHQHPNGLPLIIGDDVTVGHKAMLHGCNIGNRVLIGMGVIVLDKVHVPDDIILAAGSLVTASTKLESGYLYMGSPAKKSRRLTEAELEFLKQSATNYVVLKNEYLSE